MNDMLIFDRNFPVCRREICTSFFLAFSKKKSLSFSPPPYTSPQANPVSQAQGAIAATQLELRSAKAGVGVANATAQPLAQVLCYYDTRSGVVTGLSVDTTQICLVGDGVVPVRLSPTQVIVDVGVAPVKNAPLIGRLTFWVADTTNTTAAPVPIYCGRVPARHLNLVAPSVSTRPRNSLVPEANVNVYPQDIASAIGAEATRLATNLSGVVTDKLAAEAAKLTADANEVLYKKTKVRQVVHLFLFLYLAISQRQSLAVENSVARAVPLFSLALACSFLLVRSFRARPARHRSFRSLFSFSFSFRLLLSLPHFALADYLHRHHHPSPLSLKAAPAPRGTRPSSKPRRPRTRRRATRP